MPTGSTADRLAADAAAEGLAAYRSDWPEIGLEGAWSAPPPPEPAAGEWHHSVFNEIANTEMRLRALSNSFESALYGLDFRELRFEMRGPSGTAQLSLNEPAAGRFLDDALATFADTVDCAAVYAYARTVAGEPLQAALQRVGFKAVEQRRLYRCRISDLAEGPTPPPSSLRYLTLDEIEPERQAPWRERILALCAASFRIGSSRHFRDPILAERVPGIEYILAVMKLNFQHLPPGGFLLAVDDDRDALVGFSAVGRKPAFDPRHETLTQLLSAVDAGHRGLGVYRGLTRLLRERSAEEAWLLNVTHVQNDSIQRAYEGTGRRHFADTVVLRGVPASRP